MGIKSLLNLSSGKSVNNLTEDTLVQNKPENTNNKGSIFESLSSKNKSKTNNTDSKEIMSALNSISDELNGTVKTENISVAKANNGSSKKVTSEKSAAGAITVTTGKKQ